MKTSEHLRQVSFGRILDFTEENPLETPIAAATTLITELTTTKTALDTLAAAQDLAFGTVHGAVVDRKQLKKDRVSFLVGLGETARALDPVAHPGLAAEMRLGRGAGSYAALLSRARAMHTALVPAKAAFVAYGATATVDADLQALINALEAATQRKNNGRAIHIGGGAGIAALCKTGTAIVRKLDAILSRVYKTDPVKFAAWKAARRVQRNPVSAEAPAAPAQPPAEGSGSAI